MGCTFNSHKKSGYLEKLSEKRYIELMTIHDLETAVTKLRPNELKNSGYGLKNSMLSSGTSNLKQMYKPANSIRWHSKHLLIFPQESARRFEPHCQPAAILPT
jgi:hypothetical protein